MSVQYPDVPQHLRISDMPTPKVNLASMVPKSKVPWTPKLVRTCWEMRERGNTWEEIAEEVARITGVKLRGDAVSGYIKQKHDEGFDEEEE